MKYSDSSVEPGIKKSKYLAFLSKLWRNTLTKYLLSILIIVLTGLLLFYWKDHISYHAVSLVFLFVLSILPLMNFKPGPIFLAALTSAFIWNYYFIPPAFTLRIGRVEDALMYGMYFVIATVSSFLISRIRLQQLILDQKEKRTAALFNLTKDLSASKSLDNVTEFSVMHILETFQSEAVFIYPDSEQNLSKQIHHFSSFEIDEGEWNIAQMVFLSSKKTGRFTESGSSSTPISYFPLFTKDRKLGVAGIVFPENSSPDKETMSLLNAFLNQIGIAIEREYLKDLAKQNVIFAESEKLYKTLFDSVSHELKTPITTLLGAVTSLKDEKIIQNRQVFYRLIDEAAIATERLKRLVENLLDITRVESGTLRPKKDWHSISDLINSVLQKFINEGVDHKISSRLETNKELAYFDYALIEQALVNIVHNAVEYSPAGSTIEVCAERIEDETVIIVSNNGPGFPQNEFKNIFRKFYRIPGTKSGGLGLGLSIAKGFVEAHGGTISAAVGSSGGTQFIIKLPDK